MEAKVVNQDGVYVVTLSGQLDFESADSLRATCRKLFREKKVIFNLAQLNFVGSSGLTPFLELLGEMNKSHGRDIKLCSVSSEFVRLFEAGELYGLEVYENENGARMAFSDGMPMPVAAAPTPTPVSSPVEDVVEKVRSFGLDYSIEEDYPPENGTE